MPPFSAIPLWSGSRSITLCGDRRIELARVGVGPADDVARELDGRDLHAEADAEVGNAALARVARGGDLALDAALAEAAGHEDAVDVAERARPRIA